MRPKVYFTIKVASIIVLALVVLLISVFILNFILFSIRINGHDALLGFGPRGWGAFLHFFPWGLLLADIIFVVVLERLVRYFRFGYKVPTLYLLGGLLTSALLLGFIIDRGTDMNDRLLRQSDQHRGHPAFIDIYGGVRHPLLPGSAVCLCTVQSINDDTVIVKDKRGTTTLSLIFSDNEPNATSTGLQVGDTIFVAGEIKDGMMQTFGIKKVSTGTPLHFAQ